jgi:hypothetical protein
MILVNFSDSLHGFISCESSIENTLDESFVSAVLLEVRSQPQRERIQFLLNMLTPEVAVVGRVGLLIWPDRDGLEIGRVL